VQLAPEKPQPLAQAFQAEPSSGRRRPGRRWAVVDATHHESGDAVTAERWGVVNEAVPHAELEERALEYAATVAGKSPQAIRMLKLAFNLADDGLAGQQVFAGEATRLAYMTDEAVEGRDAFLQRRTPDWSPFPYYF